MQKIVTVLLILSFVLPLPVYAGSEAPQKSLDLKFTTQDRDTSYSNAKFAALDSADFIPVERKLIDEQNSLKAGAAGKGTSWWKWGLGILLVGGIAAAAGGGGGGGDSTGSSSTGTINVGW